MKKLYVRAKSKRDLNERLEAGDQVLGRSFGIDNAGLYGLDCLTEKCLIVVYSKMVGGNPVPISYGEFDPAKNRVK